MDKEKALKEIDESIKIRKESLESIEYNLEEAKKQAAIRESYFEGQRRATRDSINELYVLRAGVEAIE